ncbi:MAG: hypothetical protein ACXWAC_17950, partial [Usitatibacter sp.]
MLPGKLRAAARVRACRALAFAAAFASFTLHAAASEWVGARNGMVVTAQHLATEVGVEILKS